MAIGGINDFVGEIMALCTEQSVAVVFAMSRRRLAVLLRKKHQIGCVGIFFYDGAEVGVGSVTADSAVRCCVCCSIETLQIAHDSSG